jgi:glyoxylase-like metal-dependent hydrolase (beta-lactamase superfamily II)
MPQKLTQLAENVWLWPQSSNPSDVQSSVGIIVGQNETVLVDTGNSPQLANRIQDEMRQHGFPPVSQIIYTHHHWDHTYGACAFQVPVIAHSLCKTILAEEALKPWEWSISVNKSNSTLDSDPATKHGNVQFVIGTHSRLFFHIPYSRVR